MTITVMSAMEAMQTAAFRPLGRRVIAGSNPTSEQDQSGGGTATLRMAHSSRFLTGVNFIFLSSSGGGFVSVSSVDPLMGAELLDSVSSTTEKKC